MVASKSADPRSAAQPGTNANPYAGFENFTGRTFKLTFVEDQQEVSPSPGLKHARREVVMYVKSADEISSRLSYVRPDPTKSFSRYAIGPLGDINRGVQVEYAGGKLQQTAIAGTHRIKVALTSSGTACQANVSYDLMPGKDHFEMRNADGQPVNISALSAERVACRVTMGEAMGTPPESTGADASNAGPAAKAK